MGRMTLQLRLTGQLPQRMGMWLKAYAARRDQYRAARPLWQAQGYFGFSGYAGLGAIWRNTIRIGRYCVGGAGGSIAPSPNKPLIKR